MKAALSRRLARGYVAGPAVGDAVAAAHALAARGLAVTLGYWDGPDDTPSSVRDRNLETAAALADAGLDAYVSAKPKALGYDLETARPLFEAAAAAALRVHLDAHGPDGVDRSLALLERGRALGASTSFTLPGRWRRSVEDAGALAALGVPVRVVRGEWTEAGVHGRVGSAGGEGFVAVVEALAGRAPLVAVATHDASLARRSLEILRAAGTSAELELLSGFPLEPALSVARELGVRARVYVGFGYPWLPYSLRDLRSPRVLGWLLRDAAAVSRRRTG